MQDRQQPWGVTGRVKAASMTIVNPNAAGIDIGDTIQSLYWGTDAR